MGLRLEDELLSWLYTLSCVCDEMEFSGSDLPICLFFSHLVLSRCFVAKYGVMTTDVRRYDERGDDERKLDVHERKVDVHERRDDVHERRGDVHERNDPRQPSQRNHKQDGSPSLNTTHLLCGFV